MKLGVSDFLKGQDPANTKGEKMAAAAQTDLNVRRNTRDLSAIKNASGPTQQVVTCAGSLVM